MKDQAKTIFALSSGQGRAGVAVLRISGPEAGVALACLGGRLNNPREANLASLRHPKSGELLDKALTLWFPAPNSFTGEDVAELHIHGGRAVVSGVIEALSGIDRLELAEAGGFTKQAFSNQKLNLTEVEGLADLIDADTKAQKSIALRQMGGGLSDLYEGWRKKIIGLLAYVEAEIDFAEEDIPSDLANSVLPGVGDLAKELSAHLDDGQRGERLRSGYHVVLAGPPNVGKSSLLNALVRRDAAIVSALPGTTRDVIDVHLDLGGFPVVLTDTAGLRQTDNPIELEGVKRAEKRAKNADLVLWLRESGDDTPPRLDNGNSAELIVITTKIDLTAERGDGLGVSAVSGEGIDDLLSALQSRAEALLTSAEDVLITRARHRRSVEAALASLQTVLTASDSATELLAENLRAAAFELGRITGRVDVEDLLDVIFADFCIGK